MRTRAVTATAPALLAALIAGTGLAACGGDDGPGSGYTYQPFNVTLAGLPSAARMWDLTTDARSVPVAVFDVGTYSHDWGTDQWSLVDATGRAYVMGAQAAYAGEWDILSWKRGWTVEDTIGSDAKLTVAPNGDLHVAYGLGTPAGRLRR